MQRFFLIDEKTFPEAWDAEAIEMELTHEDKMKIDAEIDKLEGDFYRDPRRGEGEIREKNYTPLPVKLIFFMIFQHMFYDNEDGFWDEEIENKRKRWGETPLIKNRKYFYH